MFTRLYDLNHHIACFLLKHCLAIRKLPTFRADFSEISYFEETMNAWNVQCHNPSLTPNPRSQQQWDAITGESRSKNIPFSKDKHFDRENECCLHNLISPFCNSATANRKMNNSVERHVCRKAEVQQFCTELLNHITFQLQKCRVIELDMGNRYYFTLFQIVSLLWC